MKRIRLTFIINELSMGGAQCLLWGVLGRLDQRVFQCRVVSLLEGNDFAKIDGIPVDVIGLKMKSLLRDVRSLNIIVRYFQQHPADIVHTHLNYADFYGQVLSVARMVPTVFSTIHNSVEWPRNRRTKLSCVEDILLRRASHVFAVSNTLRTFVIQKRHCPPERISTLYNGLELGSFATARTSREETRAMLGIAADACVVLCTAQFRSEKRHDLVIEAFDKFRERIPSAVLLLLGSGGAQLQQVHRWINERNLENHVVIRSASREVISRYYGAADIFSMHSEHEGNPLALIEGMAAGLPVAVPSLPEFLECAVDGVHGRLFPFGNVDAHAYCLEQLWMAQRTGNIFWRSSQAETLKRYSLRTHMAQLVEWYCRAAQRRLNPAISQPRSR